LARIENDSEKPVELRSPLPGRIEQIFKTNGSQVGADEPLLSLNSDEESVWEALRGLALIGKESDLELISSYSNSNDASARVKKQAEITAKAITSRSSQK
jgi:hypothetical protein